jgi:hypothetical protein
MKPDLTQALNTGAMTLIGEISPLLEGTYGSGSINTLGAMMMIGALEHERGADNRVTSIREIQSLFAAVLPDLQEDSLTAKLTEAGKITVDDFKISALDGQLDRLKAVLIELHVYAEAQTGAVGMDLRDKIWQVLSDDADRNIISLG